MVSAELDRRVIGKVAFYFALSFFGEMQYSSRLSSIKRRFKGSLQGCLVLHHVLVSEVIHMYQLILFIAISFFT
jgi:hypothetical protein